MEVEINQSEDLKNIIKSIYIPYSNIPNSELIISKLNFGGSRNSFKITVSKEYLKNKNSTELNNNNNIPISVLLRHNIYSKQAHTEFSMNKKTIEKEHNIFLRLSKINLSPKILANSPDNEYRVEEFLNARNIKCYEINHPEIRKKLAITLGKINNLKGIEEFLPELSFVDKILDKDFIENIQNKLNNNKYSDKYLNYIEKMKYLPSNEEVNFIRNIVPKENLIIGHNDIWSGNILLGENETENSKKITIIDYEMMLRNFKGYDLGKLILETMYERFPDNPEYFFNENYFPIYQEIEEFCVFYLIGSKLNEKNNEFDYAELEKFSINEVIEKLYEKNAEEFNKDLIELKRNTNIGMMLSGYYSALLGILIGESFDTGMDFIKFAIDGFNIYEKYKYLVLKN